MHGRTWFSMEPQKILQMYGGLGHVVTDPSGKHIFVSPTQTEIAAGLNADPPVVMGGEHFNQLQNDVLAKATGKPWPSAPCEYVNVTEDMKRNDPRLRELAAQGVTRIKTYPGQFDKNGQPIMNACFDRKDAWGHEFPIEMGRDGVLRKPRDYEDNGERVFAFRFGPTGGVRVLGRRESWWVEE